MKPEKIFTKAMSVTQANFGQWQSLHHLCLQVDVFFDPIRQELLKKYGEDSVMIGCIEPFKLAVAQTQ